MSDDQGEPLSRITVTRSALLDVRAWLDLKMRTGRYSLGLVFELAYHLAARRYNVHSIYDEIGILEGDATHKTWIKEASEFRREPLIGFWHKHHFQAYFLAKNLQLDLSRRRLDRSKLEDSVFDPYLNKCIEEIVDSLVYDLTIGAFERRSRDDAMTGEFIVFEKQADGSNYYLTLGSHGDDDEIRQQIEACKWAERTGRANPN